MGTYSNLLHSKALSALPAQAEAHAAVESDLQEEKNEVERSTERNSVRKSERSDTSSASYPSRRRTKRYSFEFFDDQILAIKRMVYEAALVGETINQSDIVRAAVDEYLSKQK